MPTTADPAPPTYLDCKLFALNVDAASAPTIAIRKTGSDLRDSLRPHLHDIVPTAARCGTLVISNAHLDAHSEHVSWTGISYCQGASICPHCAEYIANRRAGTIAAALEQERARGCSVVLVTLTRRPAGEDMAAEFDITDNIMGGTLKRLRGRTATAGYVAGRDVAFGRFDTHPHTHVGLVVQPGHDPKAAAQRLIESWVSDVRAAGYCADIIGQDWRVVRPGRDDYRAAFYVVSGAVRRGSGGSATVRDVQEAAAAGDEDAVACMRQYVRAISDRDQVSAAGKGMGKSIGKAAGRVYQAADRKRIGSVSRDGYAELKRQGMLDGVVRRVAAAVGNVGQKLAFHEDMNRCLPPGRDGKRRWEGNWSPDHGGLEYYWSGASDIDHPGPTYYPPNHTDYDEPDEAHVVVRDLDGGENLLVVLAAPQDTAWHDRLAAKLEAQETENRRRERREQRERCEARKRRVRALAAAGDETGYRHMLAGIETYWMARASEPELTAQERRQHRFAARAQLRSVQRAWHEAAH